MAGSSEMSAMDTAWRLVRSRGSVDALTLLRLLATPGVDADERSASLRAAVVGAAGAVLGGDRAERLAGYFGGGVGVRPWRLGLAGEARFLR